MAALYRVHLRELLELGRAAVAFEASEQHRSGGGSRENRVDSDLTSVMCTTIVKAVGGMVMGSPFF